MPAEGASKTILGSRPTSSSFWASTNPSGETTWSTASIGEPRCRSASTLATSVWPRVRSTAKPSTSPALARRPLTVVEETPRRCGAFGSSFGSTSIDLGQARR